MSSSSACTTSSPLFAATSSITATTCPSFAMRSCTLGRILVVKILKVGKPASMACGICRMISEGMASSSMQ